MTNSTIIPIAGTGNWQQQKSRFKALFSNLTEADLFFENGKKTEMLTKVQLKLGKTKEEMAEIISSL